MGTQGVVSVVQAEEVVMKVVAGCDGYRADEMASVLKGGWPMTVDEVYYSALRVGFGCEDNLVVITAGGVRFDGDGDLDPLYRGTFQDPDFNPRWECGIADYVKIVHL